MDNWISSVFPERIAIEQLETAGSDDRRTTMMDGYGMAGGFGFGGIFMILWWVLIIVGIVVLVKWMITSSAENVRSGGDSKALDILKQRYARGEIDEQEFQKRKHDLTQ
jgi:putative membrane protein